MIEVVEIRIYELQDYLNKGYEFVASSTHTEVREVPIREEIPVHRAVTTDTAGIYYNYQPTCIQKYYPVSVVNTKFVLKRSLAAKLLYEKSLKNENNV